MSFFCLLTDISVAWENCSFPTKTGRYNRPGDRERKGWKWDGWIKVCRMVSSTDHSITQIKITYKLVWNTCRYYTEDDGQKTLNSLYEEWFHCEDLGTQLGPIIKRYATESCYMQYIGSNATFESSKSGFLYFQFVELCGHLQIFFFTHFERSLSYKHHNIFSWHFLHPFTFSDFLLRSSARQANLCQVRSLPGMLIYVPELRVLSGFTRHSPHSCTLYVGLK